MRWFVAAGHGRAMMFGVNGKGKVAWASPQFPAARGKPLAYLRAMLRRDRYSFYEVAR